MNKPKMKKVVAVMAKYKNQNTVRFYANETIAKCAEEFGYVTASYGPEHWSMAIDARYDFDEVVAWLESFNE